jgi:plastocyanin
LAGATGAFATVVIAGALLAHAAEGPRAAATKGKLVKVRVMDNFFDPRSINVPRDDKVKFTWKGSNRHNVRFTKVPTGASRKGSKAKREGHWTRKFGKPGLYRYVCTLFSGMRGTITVKPPPADEG